MKTKIISVLAISLSLALAAEAAPPARSGLLGRSLSSGAGKPNAAAAKPGAAGADDGVVKNPDGSHALNWENAPSDIILMAYGDELGKTVLIDPACPKGVSITLKSSKGQTLSRDEFLEAIRTVLEMNGIHIEPYRDSFIRAIPRKDARKEGIPLIMDSEAELGESGKVVSMMIPFENMSAEDAQKVLEGFKSNTGLLIVFERTNKILVTDTEQNINRMLEIARAIDVATPATEQVFVRQIKNASVEDVQKALQAIVDDAMKWQEKNKSPTNAQGQQQPFSRPQPGARRGLLGRNQPQQQPAAPVSNESLVMSVSDADRGVIRGRVLLVPDERSNKLVIITSKSNMDFFDKVIEQLDVETTPDTVVKVYRLKYADAEDVSDMINDLIGNAPSSKNSGKNQNQNAKQGSSANMTGKGSSSASAAKKPANQRTGEAKPGELSKENTTVLADKRINGIVVMTNKELVPTIEQIIESMDIKLSQVLIETVIIEVQLGDDLKTGIDWINGLHASSIDGYRQALGGGGGDYDVSHAASGATNLLISAAGKALPYLFTPGSAGLTYGVFSESLNIAAVIHAAKTDSRSKYLASPVIMTVDNKEATIDATQKRQFLTGYQVSSSVYASGNSTAPQYTAEELGIKIKVTPKINPNGTVMLEVEEEYSQLGAKQTILDPQSREQQIDTSLKRQMSADVLLENRQTVVLGGLMETQVTEDESGIPILKDIPWVGKYLFGSTSFTEARKELLVFMTPYVMDDSDSAQAEAFRRKKAMSDARPWDDHGWSDSELADPVSRKEQLRRLKDEWRKQDEERETEAEIEAAKSERSEKMKKLAESEKELKKAEEETAAENERTKHDAAAAPAAESAPAPAAAPAAASPAPTPETPEPAASILGEIDAM